MLRLGTRIALLSVIAFNGNVLANAADKTSNVTTVNISSEMCSGCVAKLKVALAKVPGVGIIEGNAQLKTMTIAPAVNATLSPKAIWDAVVQAGKTPIKLSGPSGVFSAKPAQ